MENDWLFPGPWPFPWGEVTLAQVEGLTPLDREEVSACWQGLFACAAEQWAARTRGTYLMGQRLVAWWLEVCTIPDRETECARGDGPEPGVGQARAE